MTGWTNRTGRILLFHQLAALGDNPALVEAASLRTIPACEPGGLALAPPGWDIAFMHATKLNVTIPEDRHLALALPESVPSGPAELILLSAGGDENAADQTAPRVPGSAKGEIVMRSDFDDPLEDFEPYVR